MLERRNREVDLANSTAVSNFASRHSQIGRGSRDGKDYLTLKRASASRPSGQWDDDDFDVLCNGEVVGRIFKANACAPLGIAVDVDVYFPASGRSATHGYERTREAAMAAFATGRE